MYSERMKNILKKNNARMAKSSFPKCTDATHAKVYSGFVLESLKEWDQHKHSDQLLRMS